jgi:hypothetical protein
MNKVTSHFHFSLIKSKEVTFCMEGESGVEEEVSDICRSSYELQEAILYL